jgi:uncharacterized protein YdcH (DUF465 family)
MKAKRKLILAKLTTQQSIKQRLRHLQGKHRELDKIIDYNEKDSGPASWHIVKSLKKQKLQLKDRITAVKKLLSGSTD